jgi:F0F1-type ATP synthase membrane subunit b/b'
LLYKERKKEEAKSEMQQIDEKVEREVRGNVVNLLIKMPSSLLSWICENLICEELF